MLACNTGTIKHCFKALRCLNYDTATNRHINNRKKKKKKAESQKENPILEGIQ